MSPLFVLMMLAAEPSCFVPRDSEPGWKQVTLPADGRYLSAPEGIDQFRTGDPVEVIEDHPSVFLAGSGYHAGRTQFELTPGSGACTVELTFKERLRGSKVDAWAWGAAGRMSLLQEERVAGSTLKLAWGDVGVRSLTLVVHDHLRESPIIESWRSTCRTDPAKLGISEAFQLGHSLYYLQPGYQTVPLCNKANVPMRVRSASLPKGVLPMAVSVKRD